jgi:hypothetical protein
MKWVLPLHDLDLYFSNSIFESCILLPSPHFGFHCRLSLTWIRHWTLLDRRIDLFWAA